MFFSSFLEVAVAIVSARTGILTKLNEHSILLDFRKIDRIPLFSRPAENTSFAADAESFALY